MGECCSKGLSSSYDTAIYSVLNEAPVNDNLDEVYYYTHSTDKNNHSNLVESEILTNDSYYEK